MQVNDPYTVQDQSELLQKNEPSYYQKPVSNLTKGVYENESTISINNNEASHPKIMALNQRHLWKKHEDESKPKYYR